MKQKILETARKISYSLKLIFRHYYRYFLHCFGYKCFVCLGDSHGGVFGVIAQKKLIPKYSFCLELQPGATVSGIRNPTSQTGALTKFRRVLKRTGRWNTLIISLGEVDCTYLIWHKVEKQSANLSDIFNVIIDRYFQFLDELQHLGFHKIVVVSSPLPSIPDKPYAGKVAEIRSSIKASPRERTELTIQFNHIMSKHCQERGIQYINTSDDLLDRETGVLKDEYKNPKPSHHLGQGPYSQLMAEKLISLYN